MCEKHENSVELDIAPSHYIKIGRQEVEPMTS